MKTTRTLRAAALAAALILLCGATFSAPAEETLNAILGAGTAQAFTSEPVSEEDLTAILQAGLSATSAINQQPWFFVALTNQSVMEEIASSSGFGAAPSGATPPAGGSAPAPVASASVKAALGDSPAAIILYMDEATSSPNPSFDCGLACQNMVVAANALGYGTKILSSPTMALNGENHDALCGKLGVDPALKAVAVLLIGRTDAEEDGATGASLRNEIKDKVSFVQ